MILDDPYNQAMLSEIFKRAEPRLNQLLAEHGAKSPQDLPPELAGNILRQVMIEAAATVQGANVQALSHGLGAFMRDDFGPALKRAKAFAEEEKDAFSMVAGIDAAIVLAGFGMEVAPFDRKNPRILANPTNDIDAAKQNFLRWKTAFVGYSPCKAPFYILVTDCRKTLCDRLRTDPRLLPVRQLFERQGGKLPPDEKQPFRHGVSIFPREPGDKIEMLCLMDPNPHTGSIWLFAGWEENGVLKGAPNDGYVPVPTAFLRHAMEDPAIAQWIWHPVGVRSYVQ